MPKLRGSRLVHEAKVSRYLLDRRHPEGGAKARYFMQFGFDPDSPDPLREALLSHPDANEVVGTDISVFGHKSIVECRIVTPDGRNPCITTVWIAEPGSDVQRLVTAYPFP